MKVSIYNRTSGPLKLLGQSIPRWHTAVMDTDLLSPEQLDEVRWSESIGSVHCSPSLIQVDVPTEQPKEAPILKLAPRAQKRARGSK